jgi:hypothetical protein
MALIAMMITVITVMKRLNRGSFCLSVLSYDSVYAILHTKTLHTDVYPPIIHILQFRKNKEILRKC